VLRCSDIDASFIADTTAGDGIYDMMANEKMVPS